MQRVDDDDDGDSTASFGVVHVEDGAGQSREEVVAHEEPLEIQVNGVSLAVLMRTPGHDIDLVHGFLVTEGIVRSTDDVDSVRHCTTAPSPEAEENVVQVRLQPDVVFDLERHRRHTFASSSCGVCGKATIENACRVAAPIVDDLRVAPSFFASLPSQLRAQQAAFDVTGGLHAAGLFDVRGGALLVVREDVGRHNAVDKSIGAVLRASLGQQPSSSSSSSSPSAPSLARPSSPSSSSSSPSSPSLASSASSASSSSSLARPSSSPLASSALFVSGRVSFEIVQKAAAARIPIVAGISAPSSLAVRMARALGVTLVGFVRGASMNVYAGEQRIAL